MSLKGVKVLIGASTFGVRDDAPLKLLRSSGYEVIENPYKRRLTKNELMNLLTDDVTGIIAGLETLDKKVLEHSKLKVISRCGAGLSNVDLNAAKELDIKVCYTPQGPTNSVAELTLAAILNLLRSIPQMNSRLHQGQWNKITGNLLEGKVVAIIGFGRIGQKVASLLKAFNVTIMAVDEKVQEGKEDGTLCSLNQALEAADIITLHASGNEQIIGAKEFDMMKSGVYVCNSSRGELVDENLLVEHIENGKVAGAWLDVFVDEPYSGPLQKYPQVLLTPHVGSYTQEGRLKMETDTVTNLIKAFEESYERAER